MNDFFECLFCDKELRVDLGFKVHCSKCVVTYYFTKFPSHINKYVLFIDSYKHLAIDIMPHDNKIIVWNGFNQLLNLSNVDTSIFTPQNIKEKIKTYLMFS